MSENLIKIDSVSKAYRRGKMVIPVLDDLNINIEKAEFLALMGPSGSGKTTLLNLIGGLDSPTSGAITVGDHRIDQMSQGQLAS